ncbi:lipid-A-disaccharide synthase N-terminal domain-containing protein [Cecembia calidifontis]|uniref:4-amino-4-deoxy-L-arabinose transferase n=1 Tax=Cecembia calidifontis TaxID=1187080 RepID=A0A4Q7P925_9BACT|nr:lipid-A-disaccharide synthase N-terminal domain-containing protein [Cecembia calidifontis]RZS95242.1 4-amino-4-deoxy-L-arabinose transferase [Cecembia calidifontis]
MDSFLLIGMGLIAQGLFAARFIVQLLQSEKANRVVSPAIFWQLSLMASFLLILYGFFRNDIVIVGGQVVGYLIYIRNLQLKGEWEKLPSAIRYFAYFLPLCMVIFLVFGLEYNWGKLLENPEIESMLLTWGTLGQIIFTSRFVVQWIHSEKIKESVFPASFWYISIVGAVIIAVYAIFRKDAVLFIGQSFGLVVYFRNLHLNFHHNVKRSISLFQKFKPYRLQALLIFTAMVLFFNLGEWGVTESSEARYAQIPKEMLETGDYLHPQLMGIYHYHKPPITYWITALSYKIFGVSSWSARFFLQLAILLQIWLVFRIWKLIFNEENGAFYAALVYASLPTVIIAGRGLTTDGYLATFILAALLFWFRYLKSYQHKDLLLYYLLLGLGFLTKGPVVLIVPVVLMVAQKSFLKVSFGKLSTHVLGVFIFLVIGFSWFVMLFLEDRQFLDYFLFKHTVERFASDTFKRSQPFWFYIPIIIATAFPWFLVILSQVRSAWVENNKKLLSLMAWVIVPIVFFSLSQSKLVLYVLPIYPGIALAATAIWLKMNKKTQKKWDKALFIFQMLILIGLSISSFIEPKLVLNYKFYFVLVVTSAVILSVRFFPMRVKDKTVFNAYIFIMGITAASTYVFINNAGMVNDARNIVSFIETNLPEKENILIYDSRMPSISFLSDKNIISLYDGSDDLNRETQFEKNEEWKKNLINLKDKPEWLIEECPESAVLLVKKSRLNKPMVAIPMERFKNQYELDGWVIFY